jgi:hypothetical protein
MAFTQMLMSAGAVFYVCPGGASGLGSGAGPEQDGCMIDP